ncbi:MAG TPA: FAD-dependent oxidoreductase [Ktedonobacteraceae bacterium]|nr:FAD-dependent oxidoreductase [Ktedonobacteraceae bacterium]
MREKIQDLTIIGGGVMGLFTAYYASAFTRNITILEKSTIGNKMTASFGYTRSIRNDYLDPLYARFAYEAQRLWLEVQQNAAEPLFIDCGCLNIAKESVTPDLTETYAVQSYRVLQDLHLKSEEFTQDTLQQRFPQFAVDLARLDVEAGFLYLPAVTQTLLSTLQARQVRIVENATVTHIEPEGDLLVMRTGDDVYATRQLVVTAGHGTNDVLRLLPGYTTHFPITPDRPSQCKYFIPPAKKWAQFTADALPVFAYLDVGIYGHPIYPGRTPGVKIGYYNPPDVKTLNTNIQDVHSFVAECMPELQDAETVDVQDVDQCFYDLVGDDNFILGHVPGYANVSVGVGWRGTGYKYSPWVGRVLMQLALQQGTVYDISQFNPERFAR